MSGKVLQGISRCNICWITEKHVRRAGERLGPQDSFGDTKWIFWSNNPLGNTLCGILDKLVEVGVLEFRDEPDVQFRWNAQFKTGKGGE